MICGIRTDEEFLRQPTAEAAPADLSRAQDLQDTVTTNAEQCVALATNLIGVQRSNSPYFFTLPRTSHRLLGRKFAFHGMVAYCK